MIYRSVSVSRSQVTCNVCRLWKGQHLAASIWGFEAGLHGRGSFPSFRSNSWIAWWNCFPCKETVRSWNSATSSDSIVLCNNAVYDQKLVQISIVSIAKQTKNALCWYVLCFSLNFGLPFACLLTPCQYNVGPKNWALQDNSWASCWGTSWCAQAHGWGPGPPWCSSVHLLCGYEGRLHQGLRASPRS